MQKTKRLFAMLMVIAMMLTLLPVMASAAETTTLYFNPGPWNVDGAWFDAWRWGGTTADSWVTFKDTDGDGIFEGEIPSDNTGIIFLRKDPSSSAHDWSCWNRVDPAYNSSKNYFSVTGWGSSDYSWGTYTPVVVPEFDSPIVNGDAVTFNYWNPDATSVVVAGNMNSWSTTANPMIKGEDGIWTTTISGLNNNVYQYKFVVTPMANNPWITDPKNNDAATLIDGNSTFEITDGIVPTEPTRNVTVHYRNTLVWEGTLNAYAWDYESSVFYTAGFPGDEMTLEAEHANWYTVSVALPISATNMSIQFSSGSNKGDVLLISDIPTDADSEYWYDDLTDSQFLTAAPESWADGSVEIPELELPEIVYLLPNFNWVGGDATFAAYFFNADAESEWVSMTDGNVDGVYEAYVPEGMTSVIFCRMDPAAEPSWETKWNQSPDLAIPTDGNDLYIPVQNTWDQSDTTTPWAGAWATYTEVSVPEFESPVIEGNSVTFNYWHYAASSVSVHGTMNEWAEGYEMTKGENGVWSVTINDLDDAMYSYKLVVDGCWITDPNNWEVQVEADGNQNSIFVIGDPIIQIWNVGYFFTFEEAYAASDPDRGDSITLLADITVNDLVVDKEMYLDLNGYDLTINAASATATIWAQDCLTVDPAATEWGTLIVNGAEYEALGGYVMLPEAEGHSFHSYDIQITHISLAPNSDALGYKATVTGDSAVLNAVTGFGFNMSVAGGQVKTFTTEPGENFDGTFTLRLKNILANGGGEMEITASAFVIFGEEESWNSEQQTTTMKQTLQAVDAAWETAGYTDEQKNAVKALCTEYYDDIQNWGLENIFPTIDIPITQ